MGYAEKSLAPGESIVYRARYALSRDGRARAAA